MLFYLNLSVRNLSYWITWLVIHYKTPLTDTLFLFRNFYILSNVMCSQNIQTVSNPNVLKRKKSRNHLRMQNVLGPTAQHRYHHNTLYWKTLKIQFPQDDTYIYDSIQAKDVTTVIIHFDLCRLPHAELILLYHLRFRSDCLKRFDSS